MFKYIKYLILVSCILIQGCVSTPSDIKAKNLNSTDQEKKQPRTFALLSINDVYRIEGLQSGEGGLARVRTLRKELEKKYPDLLMLHGGDLLYPSLLSRLYDGQQVIDVLNMMDGIGYDFDPRMFVVFGNHEFDKKDKKHWPILKERIYESGFRWLSTNIDFKYGSEITSTNLIKNTLIETGGVKVGLFGLTIKEDGIEYAKINGEIEQLKRIAEEQTKILKDNGAEFVVALTHLPKEQDKLILELTNGPDMIIGGHDHSYVDLKVNNRCLLKADADAITARVTTVTLVEGKAPIIKTDLHALKPDKYETEKTVQKVVNVWLMAHQSAYCKMKKLGINCLNKRLATTKTRLIGEELKIRSEESNLGNWIADQMRIAAKNSGRVPDDAHIIAIINSGALRLNQNLDANTGITKRHVEELVQYNDPLFLLPITSQDLQIALDHSVLNATKGPWLQIAGLAYTADFATKKAKNITVNKIPLNQIGMGKMFVIMPRYIATPDAGKQDGYKFKGTVAHEMDIMLKDLVESSLENARNKIIDPVVDGRIKRINIPVVQMKKCED